MKTSPIEPECVGLGAGLDVLQKALEDLGELAAPTNAPLQRMIDDADMGQNLRKLHDSFRRVTIVENNSAPHCSIYLYVREQPQFLYSFRGLTIYDVLEKAVEELGL